MRSYEGTSYPVDGYLLGITSLPQENGGLQMRRSNLCLLTAVSPEPTIGTSTQQVHICQNCKKMGERQRQSGTKSVLHSHRLKPGAPPWFYQLSQKPGPGGAQGLYVYPDDGSSAHHCVQLWWACFSCTRGLQRRGHAGWWRPSEDPPTVTTR